jgi:hypothetical protein
LHLDGIPETVGEAAPSADERRAERVQLVVVARQAPGRKVALEHAVEANEDPGCNRTRDLARKRCLPTGLEEPPLEVPGKAERIRLVLDLRGLALPERRPLSEFREVSRNRVRADAQLLEEGAVNHQVWIPADRRCEMAVSAAREA